MSSPDPEKSNPEVNVGDFLLSPMRSKLMDKVEVVVLYNNLDKTIRSEPAESALTTAQDQQGQIRGTCAH